MANKKDSLLCIDRDSIKKIFETVQQLSPTSVAWMEKRKFFCLCQKENLKTTSKIEKKKKKELVGFSMDI